MKIINKNKCGTETSKRSGDIYNYTNCKVSMSESIQGGAITACYEFDIGDDKVAQGMEIGIEFADKGLFGDDPDLYVYNWNSKDYDCLGVDLGDHDEFKWIWKTTSNSNNYISDNGIVKVLVWIEYSDWAILYHVGIQGIKIKPKLKCSDNLNFGYVQLGEEVVKSIKVENSGDSGTELNWLVKSWLSWGTWTFSPSSGNKLKPEDVSTTVNANIVAPDEWDYFTGEIIFINEDDENDYEIIFTTLSTPRNKQSFKTLIPLLLERFKQFLT